jgi:hypothetical protein
MFSWFDPEHVLIAAGWLPSGMPIDNSAAARARRAEASERTRAENAAREACLDCNHSGFQVVEGEILNCHCVAPFRLPPKPLSRGTIGGE